MTKTNQEESSQPKVSWLELFFDLVFVALVAQLTYHFSYHHHTFEDFLQVSLVGYMIFYAWIGTTANRNMRGEEDIVDILAIQGQMAMVMIMSLTLPYAFGDYSWLFFGAMAANSGILLWMIRRLYRLHPARRPKTLNMWWGFFAAVVMWSLTGLLPTPYLYVMAGCALATLIFTPLSTGKGNKLILLNMDHLLERLGLFLLMVMGEAVLVVALSNTVAKEFDFTRLVLVLSGLLIMIALWWWYFPYIDHHARGRRAKSFQVMLQAHGFLYGSLILIAGGLKIIIENPNAGMSKCWIFLAGLALLTVVFNVIRTSLTHDIKDSVLYASYFLVPLSLIAAASWWWGWPALITLPAVTLLFVAYVAQDYKAHFGGKAVIH